MNDCAIEFSNLPPKPHTRFKLISHHLREHKKWGFPLHIDEYGQKLPLVKWKSFQLKPPTEHEVANWCRRFANAGAGIPTGPGTGLLVVDADDPDAIEWLEMRGMPETVLVRTRRGLHYYLTYSVGLGLCLGTRNSAGKLANGVDIRGDGGMVVAVGTRNKEFIYHYDPGHALGEIPLADPPQWLIDWFLREEANRQTAHFPSRPQQFDGLVGPWARKVIDSELARLAGAGEGTRNDTLSRVAFKLGQLASGGEAAAGELRAALHAVADSWPAGQAKSADTIARCFEAGVAHPRQRPLNNVLWLEPAEQGQSAS